MDCSFCGRTEEEAEVVIGDKHKDIAICDVCVELCNQVIAEERLKQQG